MKEQTLVLGASANPYRYSNRAIHMLRDIEQKVLALGKKEDFVRDVEILTDKSKISSEEVDTITLYLNARNQEEYKDWIKSLNPRRVIFNPGAENVAFARELEEAGVEVNFACTLVMLRTGQY
ncbi:MAG: CoA-binding protein [Bacteroidia bacterium]|nr:CoA-binding protein [Bacteroidia bacterium]